MPVMWNSHDFAESFFLGMTAASWSVSTLTLYSLSVTRAHDVSSAGSARTDPAPAINIGSKAAENFPTKAVSTLMRCPPYQKMQQFKSKAITGIRGSYGFMSTSKRFSPSLTVNVSSLVSGRLYFSGMLPYRSRLGGGFFGSGGSTGGVIDTW